MSANGVTRFRQVGNAVMPEQIEQREALNIAIEILKNTGKFSYSIKNKDVMHFFDSSSAQYLANRASFVEAFDNLLKGMGLEHVGKEECFHYPYWGRYFLKEGSPLLIAKPSNFDENLPSSDAKSAVKVATEILKKQRVLQYASKGDMLEFRDETGKQYQTIKAPFVQSFDNVVLDWDDYVQRRENINYPFDGKYYINDLSLTDRYY